MDEIIRAEQIRGLRDMACWLEANPTAPMPVGLDHVTAFPLSDEPEHVAPLAKALELGNPTQRDHWAVYRKSFGPICYVLTVDLSGGRRNPYFEQRLAELRVEVQQ